MTSEVLSPKGKHGSITPPSYLVRMKISDFAKILSLCICSIIFSRLNVILKICEMMVLQ